MLCLFLVFIFTCFSGCFYENYTYVDGDFVLLIEANKTTNVSVEEKIQIIATLKNISGRDVYVESFSKELENIISIYCINDLSTNEIIPGGAKARLKIFKIKKDACITRELEFDVGDNDVMEYFAIASFYVIKSKINTIVKSEKIKILVERG